MRGHSTNRIAGAVLLAALTVVDGASPRRTLGAAGDPAGTNPAERECVAALRSRTAGAGRAARADAQVRARFEAAGLELVGRLRDGDAGNDAGSEARTGTRSSGPSTAGPGAPVAPPPPGPFEEDLASVVLLRAPDRATRDAAVAALRGDPAIAWIEPNLPREACDFPWDGSPPDDPLFRDTRQWALRNAGAAGVYHGLAGADIGVMAAWARTCGSNRTILGIADTGVDPAHPDLARALPDGAPRLFAGLNTGDGLAAAWADSNGHGTAVAGVMAALTHDGPHFDSLGMAGVCGGDGRDNAGCRLIPMRITFGATGYTGSFQLAGAIVHAADLGARAVNLSFAGSGGSRVERLALLHAITRGCVVVISSGNRGFAGPGVGYPAAFAGNGLCVSVGASDAWDRRAAFSSYGRGLDLVAPGLDIWTTAPTYPNAYGARYPGYLSASGTSFAAPHVTGVVGLLASLRPDLTDGDTQHVLRASAHDLGPTGWDAETGCGRLDAAAAIRAVAPDSGPWPGLWHDERAAVVRATGRFGTPVMAADSFGTFDRWPAWRGRRAELFEATVTITLPDSFADDAEVWPRIGGTTTLRGDFSLPGWFPWAEVAARDGRVVTLRGWLYRMDEESASGIEPAPDPADLWLPLPPDQARIGFTVFGAVRAAPAATAAPDAASSRVTLRAVPQPARGVVRLAGPPGARVGFFDVAGRRLGETRLDPARGTGTWSARDRDGRPLRPGLVLARILDDRGITCRVVVLGDSGR